MHVCNKRACMPPMLLVDEPGQPAGDPTLIPGCHYRRIFMKLISAALTFAVLAVLLTAPVHAQTRTWVSGVGNDVNPCSRTAPCKTFAGALSKTAAGGEINCLDPGGFGAVSPNKSLTISCPGVTAGVLVAGGNGINFNGAAADVLYLKHLDFEGLTKTTGAVGVNGISFNTGSALHVEDCTIRNFSQFGIAIKPSTNATFSVTRTTMFDNTSGGLQLRPTGGFTSGAIDSSIMSKNGGSGIA